MVINFKNVNHRKDYLSVDKLTAISAEGELFEVGDLVETDDLKLGTAIIYDFPFSISSKKQKIKNFDEFLTIFLYFFQLVQPDPGTGIGRHPQITSG